MLLVFYSVSCAWLVGFTAAGHAWVGHLRQVPVNRSDVRTAAELAVVEFNKANTEDPHTYRIDKITSAKMQIVAGVMYVLDVELENTRCNKSHTVQTENMGFKCSPKYPVMGERDDVRELLGWSPSMDIYLDTWVCRGQRLKAGER
ncbi:cystatin-C-like isoform X1 [Sphaeramia orbicularis]|uniref:cystatin-C-like isoform X1 n=1 Tax=Sphaeramia orbicularis TaxID=375764 RepID=UPI0011816A6E|nr:cystatin-C-like isoform X1 [Sphaeramia orbicularis]